MTTNKVLQEKYEQIVENVEDVILPPNYNGIAVNTKTKKIQSDGGTGNFTIHRPSNYTAYAEAVLKGRHVSKNFFDWWWGSVCDPAFKKWYTHDMFKHSEEGSSIINAFGHCVGTKFTQFNIQGRNINNRPQSFVLASHKTSEYIDGLIADYTRYVHTLNKDNPGVTTEF